MLRHLTLIVLGSLCWATSVPAPALSAHPHYERLLQRGTYALEREAYQEATRDLRLACFGLLEEPPTLVVCLTRLAVAQAAVDDADAFLETFRRIVEVEDRFGAYTEARIAPETRERFEALVTARVPLRTLEATAAFAHLVGGAGAEAVPPNRRQAPGRSAVSRPPDVEERPSRGASAEGSEPPAETREEATPAEPAPAPVPAEPAGGEASPSERDPTPGSSPPSQLNPQDRETLERAYALLAEARTREELEEPYRLAREVADANPAARGAQHLTAVIAYRSGRWAEAVRYFRRGGDPGDDDPETLFYLAVSLYEAGEPEAAAEALRRSLPRIERTPFVRSYEAKILGAEGS